MNNKGDNLSQEGNENHKPYNKGKFRKFLIWTLVVLFILFVLYWGAQKFVEWRNYSEVDKRVEDARQAWNEYLEDKYNQIKDDTYGGQTPHETLRMYIEAVEDGNYELASKYFTVENRQEELDSLNTAPKENVDMSVDLLQKALDNEGSYNLEETLFIINEPIFVEFVLYPSDVWKIREI